MRKLFCGIYLFASVLALRAEDVSVILKRMDAAAPALRALSADMKMVTVTSVINDRITEEGTFKMQKTKDGGVRAVVDFSALKDASRVFGFFGKTVRIYYPKANYYQDVEVGKNADVLNQFLLLGFGTSGEDLAKSYTITAEGMEKVAGLLATKLLLVAKDPKVKERLSKVEIWIPEGQSNPVQQEFYEPTENFRIVTYTNINLRPSIKGNLAIQMQPGASKHSS